MKKLNLFIFLLYLSNAIHAQRETTKQIEHATFGKSTFVTGFNQDDKKTYTKIYTKDSTITKGESEVGEYISFYDNGRIESKGNYSVSKKADVFGHKNLNKTGKWFYYNSKGNILGYVTHKNNRKDGPYIYYYTNGKIKYKGTFKEGKNTDVGYWYFKTGKLHKSMTYKDDNIFNVVSFYNITGNKVNYGTFKDGKGTLKEYNLETGKYQKTLTYGKGFVAVVSSKIKATAQGKEELRTYKSRSGRLMRREHYLNGIQSGKQEYFTSTKSGPVLDSLYMYKNGVKHGIYKHFNFSTHKLREEGYYESGKLSGIQKGYHENETPFYEYTYVDNIKKGPWKKYLYSSDEDFLLEEGNYDELEKLTGKFRSYLGENRILRDDGQFEKDLKVGLWKLYTKKGVLHKEINYHGVGADSILKKEYYTEPPYILKNKIHYKGGVINGDYETYYSDGYLQTKRYYLNGEKISELKNTYTNNILTEEIITKKTGKNSESETLIKKYDPINGALVELLSKKTFHKSGSNYHIYKHGVYKQLNNNSQLLISGEYHKDQKDGLWIYYWEDGIKKEESNYARGKKEGAYKEIASNGQLLLNGEFKEDKKHGFWIYYRKNGTKKQEGNYILGKKEGVWKYYNEKGKRSRKEKY